MSLTPCPECGHQVSPKAVSCPNCGYQLASSVRARRKWIGFALVALFIIVILILVVVYSHD